MRLWNSSTTKPGLFKRIFHRCQKKFLRRQGGDTNTEEDDDFEREFLILQDNFSSLGISQDFMVNMRDVFNLFDKDRSGYICSKELASVLRAYGCNPTEREVFSLMAEVDVNHNGKIDLFEFILMMHNNIDHPDSLEEMQIAFRAFDTNGDGKISKEEFKLSMMNIGERFTEEEILELFRNADIDSDGVLDFSEFTRMMTNGSRSPQETEEDTENIEGIEAELEQDFMPSTNNSEDFRRNLEVNKEQWKITVRDLRKQDSRLLESDL